MIAEMATGIEAARLLTQKSAWMIDNVLFYTFIDTSQFKDFYLYIVTSIFNFISFFISSI